MVESYHPPDCLETGIIDIEHQAKKKQIMMKHRLKDTASNLMETTMNAGIEEDGNQGQKHWKKP